MKYGNKKTVVDGMTFDSAKEAKRYQELLMLERTGYINDLKRQVTFELAPAVVLNGRKKPPLRYVADFTYRDKINTLFVVDVKGVVTPLFRVKQHLMKHIHGIEVRIV